jgi:hypothetical protein
MDKFTNLPAPLPFLFGTLFRKRVSGTQRTHMRKAIGFLIILWGLSQYFTSSFSAFDSAARESFETLEVAAIEAQEKLMQ